MQYNKWLIVIIIFTTILFSSCTSGYSNDGKEVTWDTWDEGRGSLSQHVDADPDSFEKLSHEYARDNDHAFYCGRIIENADSRSFRYLKKAYAADKNHVYQSGKVIEKADPETFKVLDGYVARDKNDYYWDGRPVNVKDKSSFVIIGNPDNSNTAWAMDKYNGYYLVGNIIVPGIDYNTFNPVKTKGDTPSGAYAADRHNVYFKDKIVRNADPESFMEVGYCIGQDKDRVYIKGEPTDIKDYSKLTKVGHLMYSDGLKIYDSNFSILADADPGTFENISDNWYKDKKHVWWYTSQLVGADPATFQPLSVFTMATGQKEEWGGRDFNYGKDAYHVFLRDSIIEGAHPASFEIIDFGNGWTVFDKNHIYKGKDSPKLRKYLNSQYGK